MNNSQQHQNQTNKKRRQAPPLPRQEVQINERGTESTNHDVKQKRSLTINETNLHIRESRVTNYHEHQFST